MSAILDKLTTTALDHPLNPLDLFIYLSPTFISHPIAECKKSHDVACELLINVIRLIFRAWGEVICFMSRKC